MHNAKKNSVTAADRITGSTCRAPSQRLVTEGIHTAEMGKKNSKLDRFKRRRLIISNVRRENNPAASDLVILKAKVGKLQKSLRVLVDSAAQAEIITEKAAKQLGVEIKPSQAKLVSAQGVSLDVCGEVGIELHFGNRTYETNAVVTPILMVADNIILGIIPGQLLEFTDVSTFIIYFIFCIGIKSGSHLMR